MSNENNGIYSPLTSYGGLVTNSTTPTVTNLSVIERGVDNFDLEWTPPVGEIDSYLITGIILKSTIQLPAPWVVDSSLPDEIALFSKLFAGDIANCNINFTAPIIQGINPQNNVTTSFALLSGMCEIIVNVYSQKDGINSDPAFLTTRTRVPAPGGLYIDSKTVVGSTWTLILRWEPGSTNEVYYEHIVELIKQDGSSATTYSIAEYYGYASIENLQIDAGYSVSVYMRIKNQDASASLHTESVLAQIVPLATKPNVAQTGATAKTATLNWAPATNASSYKVYVNTTIAAPLPSWQEWDSQTVFEDETTATLTLATSDAYSNYSQYDGTYVYFTGLVYVIASSYALEVRVDAINDNGQVTTGDTVTIQLAPAKYTEFSNTHAYTNKFVLRAGNLPLNSSETGAESFSITGKNLKTNQAIAPMTLQWLGGYQQYNIYVDTLLDSPGETFELSIVRHVAGIPFGSEPAVVYAYTSPRQAEAIVGQDGMISWQEAPGASSYSISFYDANGMALPELAMTTQNPFIITTLSPDTIYSISIRPVSPNLSFYSETNSMIDGWYQTRFITLFPEVVYDINTGSITVSWLEIQGATSYQLLYKTSFWGDYNGTGLTLDAMGALPAASPILLQSSHLSLTLYSALTGETYWFAVKAMGVDIPIMHSSTNISPENISPELGSLTAPKNVSISIGANNSIQINWLLID